MDLIMHNKIVYLVSRLRINVFNATLDRTNRFNWDIR